MSERHTMLWSMKRQRYECWCGVGYEGGEKKARAQHRDHKAGIPTPAQRLESVLRRLIEAAEAVSEENVALETPALLALDEAVVEARQTIGEP